MNTKQLMLLIFLFLALKTNAQNPEWVVFNTENSDIANNFIKAITLDSSGNKYIGNSSDYISVLNNKNNWIILDNVRHLDNNINCMKVDKSNTLWIGTTKGLVSYHDENWEYYSTSESNFPIDFISSMNIDSYNNLWLGTGAFTLLKFNNGEWQIFSDSENFFPDQVCSIEFDKVGNIWIGHCDMLYHDVSYGVLAKFDGNNWVYYNPNTSDMPINSGVTKIIFTDTDSSLWIGTRERLISLKKGIWYNHNPEKSFYILDMDIDKDNILWIATRESGLARFNGDVWTVWTQENSDLPDNHINCIEIDKYGNKWIGTNKGLAVFREGGVILDVEDEQTENELSFSCYPNPVQDELQIDLPGVISKSISIKLYDIFGRDMDTIYEGKNDAMTTISYSIGDLPQGIYFIRLHSRGQVRTKRIEVLR